MTARQRLTFWLAGLAIGFFLLYVLSAVLLPFVVGMVIAYFLDPLADKLEDLGLSRGLATAVLTAGFFAVVIVLLMLLLPVLQGQIIGFVDRLPEYAETLREWTAPLVEKIQLKLADTDAQKLQDTVAGYAGKAINWFATVLASVWSGGMALVNVVSLMFITPLVTFYLIRDWDRIVAKVDGWLPRANAKVIREQVGLIDRTLAGFMRGQATVCLVLATYYGTSLSVIGLDFGLIVGVGAGLISFIPYFGAIVGVGTGIGIALFQFGDPLHLGLVAGVFAVGQLAEGYLLTPKLVGERVGLHPVWIIFALMAGGALFGFTGVVLAVPVAAVIGVLTRFALERYMDSPLYHGTGSKGDGS